MTTLRRSSERGVRRTDQGAHLLTLNIVLQGAQRIRRWSKFKSSKGNMYLSLNNNTYVRRTILSRQQIFTGYTAWDKSGCVRRKPVLIGDYENESMKPCRT